MQIRYLKTLIAIADHGSFAAAADVVHQTLSAISMQMKALETEFGRKIFDRTRRPPALNTHGLALVAGARQITLIYEQLQNQVSINQQQISGVLNIGVIPTVITGILPFALSVLRISYPKIKIFVRVGFSPELLVNVRRGEIDAAIIGKPKDIVDELYWRPIVSERLTVIAPKTTKQKYDKEVLQRLPFIRFDRRTLIGQLIDAKLRSRKVSVNDIMELNSLEACSVMVSQGLGASVVPIVGNLLPYAVKRIPFGNPQVQRIVGLIERTASPRQRLTSVLYDELARLGNLSDTIDEHRTR
jgi:DNA-binding transcriptional LysR family regulator